MDPAPPSESSASEAPNVRVLQTRVEQERARGVAQLREVLAMAERGELRDFVLIATLANRPSISHVCWHNAANVPQIVGQLEVIKHQLIAGRLNTQR